jgi:hypothetical protein
LNDFDFRAGILYHIVQKSGGYGRGIAQTNFSGKNLCHRKRVQTVGVAAFAPGSLVLLKRKTKSLANQRTLAFGL